ncbi:MAG: glycosyltransferase family 2 protein [Bilifractor sp.]
MPTISIIIPIYDAEKYLERCLTSVINQDYPELEILLVDDGSTDKSSTIASRYYEQDSRIKYFRKSNGGVSSARNLGLEKATGEWIAFVDADDWIDKSFCSKLLNIAQKNNLDIVECRRIDEKSEGSFLQEVTQKEKLKVSTFSDFIPTNEDFYGTCWGFLFKAILCKDVKFDTDIYFAEDALFSVEVMKKSSQIGIVNEYLYHYNLLDHKSLSQGKYDEKKYTLIESRSKQLQLFFDCAGYKEMKARLGDACFYIYNMGKNDPIFQKTHYTELKNIFRKCFFTWNRWSKVSRLHCIARYMYYLDLNFTDKLMTKVKSLINS